MKSLPVDGEPVPTTAIMWYGELSSYPAHFSILIWISPWTPLISPNHRYPSGIISFPVPPRLTWPSLEWSPFKSSSQGLRKPFILPVYLSRETPCWVHPAIPLLHPYNRMSTTGAKHTNINKSMVLTVESLCISFNSLSHLLACLLFHTLHITSPSTWQGQSGAAGMSSLPLLTLPFPPILSPFYFTCSLDDPRFLTQFLK